MGLKLNATNGGGSVELDVPDTVSSDLALTVPAAAGTIDRLERAGNVLQVVAMSDSTQTTSTANSYIDTTITLSITPQFSSSKVLVMVVAAGLAKRDQNTTGALQLLRGSTVLSSIDGQFAYNNSTQHIAVASAALNYLDSPATTSATTYKVQVKNNGATGDIRVNWDNNSTSSMVLLEVAA